MSFSGAGKTGIQTTWRIRGAAYHDQHASSAEPGRHASRRWGRLSHGSAVAALSNGRAVVPLMNAIGYDLVLPGNWEVAYRKEMLIENLNSIRPPRCAATCFMQGVGPHLRFFPRYQSVTVSGIPGRFCRLQRSADADAPVARVPRGIRFTRPERIWPST